MKYAAGYGMAWMCYTQLYYIYETGEAIQVSLMNINYRKKSNKQIYIWTVFQNNSFDAILYEVNWYNLPRDVQKDIAHLINRMQNGVKLTAGLFGCVNREFFKLVCVVSDFNESFCVSKWFNRVSITDYQQNLQVHHVLIEFWFMNEFAE